MQALVFLSVLAVLAAEVQGRHHGDRCPPQFSCGHLQNISYPFRRRGDPPGCGVESYELACSDSKATIQINTRAYYVTRIDYTASYLWVVDANLDMHNSCLLPRWDHLPYTGYDGPVDSNGNIDLATSYSTSWASYVNCSREITNNSWYKPVTCLSKNNSFVYVSIGRHRVGTLEPSCGYLAMIPFGGPYRENASYAVITESIKNGFSVLFPFDGKDRPITVKKCLKNSISYFHEQMSGANILNRTRAFAWSEMHFLGCVNNPPYKGKLFWVALPIVSAIDITKLLVVLSRFVLAPLAVFIFLAHKYWKTRITIDAVERFLRMQHMLGPTRYAYTDITAITNHFRDKLGQGGYGSVYKGTLLPGDVHVAIKMLGTSNCNGEEFISEVSTIGRIHHVNVVRLVGFCSEEMRRALVYEYMPRGSLDKYIFSSEKTFSWDKLNEIALGIARGINYLHQGCDMQILHFDIKPHNILLDNNFVPKVADFGLAKLYPRDNSFVPMSAMRGTVGYIAPEMISRSFGAISSKADVYSFGMLLLEMAGGRRNADPNTANSSQSYYPSWVYSQLVRQEMCEIADDVVDMHELEIKLSVIGLWCIQMKANDRPTMSEVIEMLEGGAEGLQVPPNPFFCEDEQFPAEDSYHFCAESELTAISEDE